MKRCFLAAMVFVTALVAVNASEPAALRGGVRVDVPTGDVREVLRMIADAAGISVLVPGELSGTVSLRLDGVPYAEAFDAILRARGYTWRVMGSGFVVIERASTLGAVVALRSRSAEDVQEQLSKILRSGESVHAAGEEVLIEADPERTRYLVSRARALDRPLRQVLVECRFQEMSSQLSRSLGINWSSLGSYGVSVTPKSVDLGAGQALGAVLSAAELALVLSALDTTAGTRVVSRPTVLAFEGYESVVAIGQQYPLPQYTFSQEQSLLQVSGFQFKDIGVLLKVRPEFVGDRVVLDLEPEVSSVASTTTFAGAGAATLPVIATRRVQTRVELRSGETIAISGLIASDDSNSRSNIRGLGRVPILGALFRSKAEGNNRSEMVVFLTVRQVLADMHADQDAEISSRPRS